MYSDKFLLLKKKLNETFLKEIEKNGVDSEFVCYAKCIKIDKNIELIAQCNELKLIYKGYFYDLYNNDLFDFEEICNIADKITFVKSR